MRYSIPTPLTRTSRKVIRTGESTVREGRPEARASVPFPDPRPAEAPEATAAPPPPSAAATIPAPLPSGPPPADPASLEVRMDAARKADVAELDLTGSQRTTIDALLRREAFELEELRGDLERFGPDVWAVVSARAREAHAATLAAVRQALMPEQAERFDRWVREGRWPGYALPVPAR